MVKFKIIFITLAFLIFCGFATKAFPQSKPFTIQVIKKPEFVAAGNVYKITLEIKNQSSIPLTLSSLNAVEQTLYWNNKDGSGGGTGVGPTMGKLIILTSYNPETGEFICKHLEYDEGDFFTLPQNETKQFEVEFSVPKEVKPLSIVTVEINYESKYDGREIGLMAWTGKAKTLKVKIRTQGRIKIKSSK